jgi:hypothetical protein|tara:strand:- start:949 stop:1311 length:363 start_codon:yes stop_codon:yes gene_type:complete|mmetsp:Transcript_17/g.58  ORF Transcript_17/g.58 Transcript_17/m.58 type:complete len:121 (-) Transcript_17:242-604(-)|eukprot:CAMPEP_0119224970 /NCGR_PEP_ID=MMETSP1327-20130426/33932_1 /TAXON_ID=38833 /ORGANISM="Micromonas pusilla, Strain RCC2306" /LENGTH=120 /DNA_ID=CAMNT_0007223249 /DNA_START=107 /DNA_END=469 /DNA_ORIENTATION=+
MVTTTRGKHGSIEVGSSESGPKQLKTPAWLLDESWNLEDRFGFFTTKLVGLSLVCASACVLYLSSMALVQFLTTHDDDGVVPSNQMTRTTYYALLVPVTLPAAIVFVYLNWLSASFFKAA